MKALQQDDIQHELNDNTRKRFWFIHKPTNKLVKACDKAEANVQFRLQHKIQSKRDEVRQARFNERP